MLFFLLYKKIVWYFTMAYIFRLFFRKTASIDYHAACNFSDLHQGFAQTMDEESQCEVDGKRESEKKRSDGRDKTMNIFKRLCLFSEVNS